MSKDTDIKKIDQIDEYVNLIADIIKEIGVSPLDLYYDVLAELAAALGISKAVLEDLENNGGKMESGFIVID